MGLEFGMSGIGPQQETMHSFSVAGKERQRRDAHALDRLHSRPEGIKLARRYRSGIVSFSCRDAFHLRLANGGKLFDRRRSAATGIRRQPLFLGMDEGRQILAAFFETSDS
jgi:hypothetical protein